jgi:BirA family transcriptional regulator, biotin operon repressor / biotin---[acetyl-CoA-carboxylase] ligase
VPDTSANGWRVRWVDEVDSTNRVLMDEARAGAAGGEVLVADHQTAGRGRLSRTWTAPPGANLLVSVLLRPSEAVPVEQAHRLTMAAGLAATTACEEVSGVRPGLKWPNDLEVDGRKLAGLLAESVVAGRTLEAVVVGMGLNVAWAPEGAACLGPAVDRRAVLDAFLRAFGAELADLDGVAERYRGRCSTLGRRVRVELPDGSVEGVAVAVGADGRLEVDVDGRRRTFTVGDVVHLRPR